MTGKESRNWRKELLLREDVEESLTQDSVGNYNRKA